MHKTLLVTGGAGFIGSNFVEAAVAQGKRLIILDSLTYAGHRANLDSIRGPGSFELVVGDICDGPLVHDLLTRHNVDALINFAAESHVDRSISEPGQFVQTNVVGTYTLLKSTLQYWERLDSARKETFRYVQISTDEVYGSLGETGKFSETSTLAPNSPYSASKASADLLTRAWHHTYGLPTITTNCSNNYGPRQFPEKLIPHMITCALSNRPLPVYGDGKNVRDWIHVEDHCSGISLALEKGISGQTYCFGGNAERNNLELLHSLCKILDDLKPRADGKPHSSAISFVTDRKGHDRRYAIDDTLAQRQLGFVRKHTFEAGLLSTIRWYLDNKTWCQIVSSS